MEKQTTTSFVLCLHCTSSKTVVACGFGNGLMDSLALNWHHNYNGFGNGLPTQLLCVCVFDFSSVDTTAEESILVRVWKPLCEHLLAATRMCMCVCVTLVWRAIGGERKWTLTFSFLH